MAWVVPGCVLGIAAADTLYRLVALAVISWRKWRH